MKLLKILFHSLVGTVNVVVIVLFLLAAYSDRISPEKSTLLAFLGLAFGPIALVNFCFFLYWLVLRKWVMAGMVVLAFLAGWGAVSTYFPLHCSKQKVPEGALKILSYNVMSFDYQDTSGKGANEIVRYIAGSGADIVCLQEYAVHSGGNTITPEKLSKALSMYPYRRVMNRNIAVFSKYPIVASRQVRYPSASNASSVHELDINGKKLFLINNHLESIKLTTEDKTKYKDFIKSLGSDQFDGFKGTIRQKLGPAFRIRARQAEILAEEIRKMGDAYIVVCGDFNDTPVSYARRTVQGPLGDAFAESGCGLGISYNRNLFFFRIDHMLHSRNLRAYRCTVDRSIKASDHYPIWCYLVPED